MLTEQGYRFFGTYTQMLYYMRFVPLIKDYKSGRIRVCTNRKLIIFILCNLFCPLHCAYSLIKIKLEMSKSHVNERTIFFSTLFFFENLCECFVLTTMVTKRYRISKCLTDMRAVTSYWTGEMTEF